ncbi:hypothetical protein OSB04_003318 [Centaurea solstitialis]|uniref:Integrase catalytic domain-containing protein n=1 Tax=Centaurea solstitialis TaxID=347529 RepID=A0AA38WNM8_9ASTR|nr:hypothetical protein OSB04_003318 [Centaurea solstitialis]
MAANPPNPTASQLVFAIGNVYPQFSFKVTTDGSRYKLWRRIFTDMCKGAKVMGYITGTSKPKDKDDEDWEAIDSRIRHGFIPPTIALQKIYGKPWTLVFSIINCPVAFSFKLPSVTQKKGALSITDYCHTLKDIADSLADVDTKISEQDLVLQILQHLPPSYQSLVDVITHTNPFPSFLEAKNMLLLHESREDQPDPTTDTHLSPSSALYSTSAPTNTGKTRYKNNRGNKNTGRVTSKGTSGGHPPFIAQLLQLLQNVVHQQQVQNPQSSGPRRLPAPSAPIHGGFPAPSALFVAPPQTPQPNSSAPQFTDLGSLFSSMSVQQPTPTPDNNYYMDTGASSHMSYNQGNLLSLKPCGKSKVIMVGIGALLPVSCVGDTFLPLSHTPLALKNVLVSDQMVKNLISVRRFTIDNWVSVEFDPFGFSIKDLNTGHLLHRSDSVGDLYPVLQSPQPSTSSATGFVAVSPLVWHRRLGHPGVSTFSFLKSRNFISGSNTLLPTCHACQLGKHCHLSFSHSTTKTSKVFELVHSDLWTSPISSLSGYKYYIVFLDDFSHFLWVFPLRVKSDMFHVFSIFRAYVVNQFKTDIQSFQCDNGREFNNANLLTLFQNNGIKIRFSCPYTSQQNGKAERAIRTINNVMRTLLFQASLPPNFWAEALNMTVHILNLLPTTTLSFQSPCEILYGTFPTFTHLRVFGCLCYPNLSSTAPHKLSPCSTACVYLGPSVNQRGHRCYDLVSHRIIISRHVVFDEDHFPYASFNDSPPVSAYDDLVDDSSSSTLVPDVLPTSSTSTESPQTSPTAPTTSGDTVPTATTTASSDAPSTGDAPSAPTVAADTEVAPGTSSSSTYPMTTRSRTGNLKPRQILNLSVTDSISPIPTSTAQAVCDPHWKEAMDFEMSALLSNYTWDLVLPPASANIVGSRWLFRHKFDSQGHLARYKARLVAQGFSQQPGLDYDETFSPIVKPATIRTVLSIAVSLNWPIHQLDVKNAFLNGDLTKEVYMKQPPGYVHPSHLNHVCRLRKALYGLKQSPRAWFHRFAVFITSLGFSSSKSDSSLFVYHHGRDTIYLLLYVDDIILTASSPDLVNRVISRLSSEFKMTDLGAPSFFWELLTLVLPRAFFCLNQFLPGKSSLVLAWILVILAPPRRRQSRNCPPLVRQSLIRLFIGVSLVTFSTSRLLDLGVLFGRLNRLDISYAVQQICLFMHDPREPHFNALKRILRYLQGTLSMGLFLRPSPINRLVSYTHADWAGCPDTRRSTSGFCVFLGDNLVSWSSKRQHVVSRSSAEAEYRGIANAVAESAWLCNLLIELRLPLSRATVVFCDNVSAMYLANNPVQHQRTKHVEIDLHFVRERVAIGHVRVLHVPSSHQFADIFTKGLPTQLFLDFRSSLSIRSHPATTAGGVLNIV